MVNDLLLILILQMAALVRRALVEVCTVPMLLFFSVYGSVWYIKLTIRQPFSALL